ncbi:hypothetical protein EV360DRAFT_86383 [Lentinula raphanica]|nr:hypothetical protein EV360DRAFT_86383 [Lentinula raphanica]
MIIRPLQYLKQSHTPIPDFFVAAIWKTSATLALATYWNCCFVPLNHTPKLMRYGLQRPLAFIEHSNLWGASRMGMCLNTTGTRGGLSEIDGQRTVSSENIQSCPTMDVVLPASAFFSLIETRPYIRSIPVRKSMFKLGPSTTKSDVIQRTKSERLMIDPIPRVDTVLPRPAYIWGIFDTSSNLSVRAGKGIEEGENDGGKALSTIGRCRWPYTPQWIRFRTLHVYSPPSHPESGIKREEEEEEGGDERRRRIETTVAEETL